MARKSEDKALQEEIERLSKENSKLTKINESLKKRVKKSMAADASAFSLFENNLRLTNEIERRTEELKAAKERAEEALKVKTEFLANMSHELRTPLNGIIGLSDLLSEKLIDEENKDLVVTINESGKLLLQVVNSILDFSKLEAKKVTLQPVPFSLHNAIHQVEELLGTQLCAKSIHLIVNISNSIPQELVGDEFRLKQVLINLMANAIKFTPEDGFVMLHLKSRGVTDDRNCFVEFIVSDNGIGIDENCRNDVLKPFEQADGSTTRQYGGTGLGLSISVKLVELLGGRLKLHSRVGVGTTFEFTLPFEIADTEGVFAEQNLSSPNIRKNNSSSRTSLKVLLAEDNRVNQKLAEKLLQSQGHTVKIAPNGLVALEMVQKEDFDIVLMDVQMPEMDGVEACQRIRKLENKQKAKVPIIALTANALAGDREYYIAKGMDDYISKPFDKNLLFQIIERYS